MLWSELEIGGYFVSDKHGRSLKITNEQLFSFVKKLCFYERPETLVIVQDIPVPSKNGKLLPLVSLGKLVGCFRNKQAVKFKCENTEFRKRIQQICDYLNITCHMFDWHEKYKCFEYRPSERRVLAYVVESAYDSSKVQEFVFETGEIKQWEPFLTCNKNSNEVDSL